MLATDKTATGPTKIVPCLVTLLHEKKKFFFFFFCYACIGTSVFSSGNVKYKHKREWTNSIKEPEPRLMWHLIAKRKPNPMTSIYKMG